MPVQSTRQWGKLLLPETLMMSVFSFAGCNTTAVSLFVCSDWFKYLSSKVPMVQKLWEGLATSEGIPMEHENCKSLVIEYVTRSAREKKKNAMASLEEKITSNFGSKNGSCLRLR